MVTLDFLNALKAFLQAEVASKITLQQEDTDDSPVYVNPYVEICYLPHKNFSPYDFQVPLILISLDDGEDAPNDHIINIRLTLATYGGGFYSDTKIPDAKGYIDLLNLSEFIRQALIKTSVIGGCGTVQRPINYGMYDTELIYPYWYGYVSFSVSIPATEYSMLNF